MRFAAHGLDGASTEAIARDAGVSTATLYRQFATKLDLFAAVCRDAVADFSTLAGSLEAAAPRARIAPLAHAYAALLDDPERAGLLRALFSAVPASPDAADVFYTQVKATVAGAFHAAIDTDASEPAARLGLAPEALTGALMGMIEHATLWRRLLTGLDGDQSPDAIAREALAAFAGLTGWKNIVE